MDKLVFFKKNPKRVMSAFFDTFCIHPHYGFSKVRNIAAEGLIEDKVKKHEEKRQKKEDAFRESMEAERCELISKLTNANANLIYLFDGFEYKTIPTKWNSGHRVHKAKCIRITPNYVKKFLKMLVVLYKLNTRTQKPN